MKKLVLAVLIVGFAGWAFVPVLRADDPKAEMQSLVAKINTKLKAGNKSEADLADELKAFDALIAKHKGEKTDEVAEMIYMEAALYKQVLDNDKKGDALLADLKRDFPDTKIAKTLKMREEGEKIAATLVAGAKFPEFTAKDLAGKPLALSGYKGKVVLVDFWATWCPPCVGEVPNVVKTYEKYHTNGFEIIGVSLDREKPALEQFIKKNKMPWSQIFDEERSDGQLAAKYGVDAIPTAYLLDGEGRIITSDLRGDALEKAVAKALAKK